MKERCSLARSFGERGSGSQGDFEIHQYFDSNRGNFSISIVFSSVSLKKYRFTPMIFL